MARSDAEWVQDIVAAIADIRADTLDMDFAAFAAKPTIVRSVLYSIAVMGEGVSEFLCVRLVPSHPPLGERL